MKESPCSKDYTNFKLQDEDKNKVPYTGLDTLTFLRSTDSLKYAFYGGNWQSSLDTVEIVAECVAIHIRERRALVYQSPSIQNVIHIDQHSDENYNYFEIRFKSKYFVTVFLSSPYVSMIDSMTIQGKLYKNIRTISRWDGIPTASSDSCFYTWKDGILKFIFADGETWEVIK